MDVVVHANRLASWSYSSIQWPKGFTKVVTIDWTFINIMVHVTKGFTKVVTNNWTFINIMVHVTSLVINCWWFQPNRMVWNKLLSGWMAPFWFEKMLNFAPKKKHQFKPIGVYVKALLTLYHWTWLGGCQQLFSWVCNCVPQKNTLGAKFY
jgi:hypothetical protein